MPVRPRRDLSFNDLTLNGRRQGLALSKRQPEVLRPLYLLLKCRNLLGHADGAIVGGNLEQDLAWCMAHLHF